MNAPRLTAEYVSENALLTIYCFPFRDVDARDVLAFTYNETRACYEIRAFLPKLKAEDIQIALHGRRLQVLVESGTRSARYGEATVPLGSKPSLVQATFHEGLLTIRMFKRQTGLLG